MQLGKTLIEGSASTTNGPWGMAGGERIPQTPFPPLRTMGQDSSLQLQSRQAQLQMVTRRLVLLAGGHKEKALSPHPLKALHGNVFQG